jgi:hypothetical protein
MPDLPCKIRADHTTFSQVLGESGSMAARDEIITVAPKPDRYQIALYYYEIVLAVLMMGLGLRQWGLIVGFKIGGATFEAMSAPAKIVTMYLAVADLVAAVGLWMRVAWGRVIFIAAAISDIGFHTAFVATYGANWVLVAIHAVALVLYAILAVLARRRPAETA